MPKPASGQLVKLADGYGARITIAPKTRQLFTLSGCHDEAEAEERKELLATMAQRLRRAGHEADAPKLLEMAAARRGPALEDVIKAVDVLIAGKTQPIRPEARLTFQGIGEKWTRGDLHRLWPDHVPTKRSVTDDEQRLKKLYETIGPVRLVDFQLSDAERAMRALPEDISAATRRHYAQLIQRVLNLAVYPLRIIAASPIPKGFKPKLKGRKAFSYLYPDEDAALLACEKVPLGYRVLYGLLAREGLRVSEALALRIRDVDDGVITLDANKTDDPREWSMDPGVAEALELWVEHWRKGADGDARLITNEDGTPLDMDHAAERFRAHLGVADVDRPELFERTPSRMPVRVHDLRATFVTLSLAHDKSETWVSDRTGHKSSQMIHRYKRAVRAARGRLGELTPLAEAIPEMYRAMIGQRPLVAFEGASPNPAYHLWAIQDLNLKPTD